MTDVVQRAESVLKDLSEQVRAAASAGRGLRIVGGDTKAFYGQPFKDGLEPLHLSALSGILNYEPTELVITALAGTPLSEIETVLAANNQFLAFEPPQFGAAATIGGCVAAGLSGPRRAAAGSARDFVLGTRLLDASGQVLRFGGEVMKNVAGYDVSRLLAGSLGFWGPIVEVSIKVLPKPITELTLQRDCSEQQALEWMNLWASQPHPISATAWLNGELYVRLSGSEPAVADSRKILGGEALAADEAGPFWDSLRHQTHSFFAARPLWRLGTPSRTPPLALGPTLIEWGGAQRWIVGDDETLLRSEAARVGGHATAFRWETTPQSVFQPLSTGLMQIHRRLKQELDPKGIFNPGRLYSGL